jgi:hypothetical protein
VGAIPSSTILRRKKVGELNEKKKSESASVGTRSPQPNGITHPLSPVSSQSVVAADQKGGARTLSNPGRYKKK